MRCFITQPIHADAIAYLETQGIETVRASAETTAALETEIGQSDAVITRDMGFPATAFDQAPRLRLIACHGAGTNRIAVAEATKRGVLVTRAPGVNSRSVAEMTIGLMLAIARRLPQADQAVRHGAWSFRHAAGGIELNGQTLGLIGFGEIGRQVASIALHGLGMRVLVWSPSMSNDVFAATGVTRASSVEAVLANADVVSLHRPPDARPPFVLDAEGLSRMRPGALLINTSRGAAVDGPALAEALHSKRLGGAALDVLPVEPPLSDDPLLAAPNLILAPHIGAATEAALRRVAMLCATQVCDVLAGRRPDYIVSG